ncbi:hypothetical protein K3495_g10911 [Podosphaera aphanis]|nr:hypothetical protein K3495_g10911 [Podosphaera aphanis]
MHWPVHSILWNLVIAQIEGSSSENQVVMLHDFHPFWHINRPALGNEYQVAPLPKFDPITLSRR